MESRKGPRNLAGTRASALPVDYLQMVRELFTTHFDEGLKALAQFKENPEIDARGTIFPDEVILSVSIGHVGHVAATTVHASCDFDPKASVPTAQDLLSACVDALGGIFEILLDPKHPARLEQLAAESLTAFENIPFEWAAYNVDRYKVFLKVDKANPKLDELADDFLRKNDPDLVEREKHEEEETEKLFVTGKKRPPKPGDPDGGGEDPTFH
jgi:hypothetical protein